MVSISWRTGRGESLLNEERLGPAGVEIFVEADDLARWVEAKHHTDIEHHVLSIASCHTDIMLFDDGPLSNHPTDILVTEPLH